MESIPISNEAKKHRKRKKQLLNSIQEQLDFYFSDANLRHDRFLRKEIEENDEGYVSLETMLKFNKLKNLGTELEMLVKAVENSTSLQLSKDGSKVKRTIPVLSLTNTDADERTVYVEQLHAYCDHSWIKQVFSTCGVVDYVSLPRYKHDNKIKGFAFIEFSNASEAEKACRILDTAENSKNKPKKRNPIDKEHPNLDENLPAKRKRKRSTSACESENDSQKQPVSNTLLKRRRSVSECSEGSPLKSKKKRKGSLEDRSLSAVRNLASKDLSGKLNKHNGDEKLKEVVDNGESSAIRMENISGETELSYHDSKEKKVNISEDLDNKNITSSALQEEKTKKKKNRKHPQKDKQQKEIVVPPLYVISKVEWLLFKKQYKHLQINELRKLKNTMRILRSEKVRRKELKERIIETTAIAGNAHKSKATEHIVVPKNIDAPRNVEAKTAPEKNTELTGKKRKLPDELNKKHEEVEVKKTKIEAPKYEMEPGSVARVSTSDENMTKDIIKKLISPHTEVAYVDFLNGSLKGYLRFKSAEMLNIAMKIPDEIRNSWKFKIEKLEENEEKQYFIKAIEDRQKRYELNEKKKKKREERGTTKVLKFAEEFSKT